MLLVPLYKTSERRQLGNTIICIVSLSEIIIPSHIFRRLDLGNERPV